MGDPGERAPGCVPRRSPSCSESGRVKGDYFTVFISLREILRSSALVLKVFALLSVRNKKKNTKEKMHVIDISESTNSGIQPGEGGKRETEGPSNKIFKVRGQTFEGDESSPQRLKEFNSVTAVAPRSCSFRAGSGARKRGKGRFPAGPL